MTEENQNNEFSAKPMFKGNWKCAKCGTAITELPFEPGEGGKLFCKECYASGTRTHTSPKPMVQGDWECSGCKKAITQLPFQPSGDRPIYCLDCYRSNRS